MRAPSVLAMLLLAATQVAAADSILSVDSRPGTSETLLLVHAIAEWIKAKP